MARSRSPGQKAGYKTPPEHTRWRKGQSGNPKGRPKRTHTPTPAPPVNLSEEHAQTLRLLSEEVTWEESGIKQRMTSGEAVQRALIRQAMAGDVRAIKLVQERDAHARQARDAARASEVDTVALTAKLTSLILSSKREQAELPPSGADGEAEAEGPAPGGPEMWADPGEPGAAAEAGDPFADTMAEECAPAAPTSAPSRPDQPSAWAGGAPPPAPASGMVFGNAPTYPQPPRIRPQHRASSSEPLIKDNRPLTGRF